MNTTRPKMHIWGPGRVQKVIFVDELEHYEANGWRDHPNKLGKPVEGAVIESNDQNDEVSLNGLPGDPVTLPYIAPKRGRKPKS